MEIKSSRSCGIESRLFSLRKPLRRGNSAAGLGVYVPPSAALQHAIPERFEVPCSDRASVQSKQLFGTALQNVFVSFARQTQVETQTLSCGQENVSETSRSQMFTATFKEWPDHWLLEADDLVTGSSVRRVGAPVLERVVLWQHDVGHCRGVVHYVREADNNRDVV